MKQCNICNEIKPYEFFNKRKTTKDGYQYKCKSCAAEHFKQWQQENKEHSKEYFKQYKQENKDRINKYQKERKKTDVLFRLSTNLRSRTWSAFKNKGYSKNTKTQEMLGVEWEVAKLHIERQFTKGMNWSNYGEWHIDHIIPLASANTEQEIINLCHYTNLQPLWAEENFSKGCKTEEIQIKILL